MLNANLYIDRIDLARYLSPAEVSSSGARNAGDLAARLKMAPLSLRTALFSGLPSAMPCPWR